MIDGAGWSEGPLVYVASSYDTGDKNINLQRAFAAAENVVKKGGFPIVPHTCHLWHTKYFYHSRLFWLTYSMRLLSLCHCMIICPGSEFSPWVSAERNEALQRGIPVLTYDEFLRLEKFPPLVLVNECGMTKEEVFNGSRDADSTRQKGDDVESTRESISANDVDQEAASNNPCV